MTVTRKVNAHTNLGTLQAGDVVLGERVSGTTGLFTVGTLGGVTSVNGETGVVSLTSDDISTLAQANKFVTASDVINLGNLSGINTGDQTISLTGDVTGSGTGSFAATIANDAVTYAKMQNVSATDKLLGRSTSGAGDVEEIACTAAGRALIDDADASAQRTTLGLGTLATQSGTFVNWSNATSNIYTTGYISTGTENETSVTIGASLYNAQISAHVESATDFDYIAHRHNNTDATAAATYVMSRSRGTGTAESVVITGDRLGEIAAIGFDGTDYAFGARIQFDSTGTIGADSIPTKITFKVAPDGGGAPATAMTINANKNVDFTNGVDVTGAITSTANLTIGGNATAAGYIDLLEDSDNGTNKVTITAPQSITSDKTITLQDVTGTVYVTGGTDVSVADGGTGVSSVTAYAPIVGGTTSTGALQSTASGSAGQVLQSAGNAAVPTWSTPTYPNASGTSGKILVSDGTNNVYSTPTFPNASATTRKIIVSDGTNWTASTETYAVPSTSGNVLTSDGTNWTSAAPAAGGMTMNTASGTTQALAVGNGYICTNASQCNGTLPATAAVGALVKMVSQGAGGIKMTANTGQTIKGLGDTTTSAGSITCAAQYDSLTVICIVANTTWAIDSFVSSLLTFA